MGFGNPYNDRGSLWVGGCGLASLFGLVFLVGFVLGGLF